MTQELLYRLKAPNRDHFAVWGLRFGRGEVKAAVIAGLRGDEIQQVAAASHLAKALTDKEGLIAPDTSLLVIPAAHPHAFNTRDRYWGLDHTDINRMFPGFDQGETTQRIAQGLLDQLSGIPWGLNLTSLPHPGAYAVHARLHKTGFEDLEAGRALGLPWLHLHEPNAQETGSLNYNWQIWGTKAYSLVGGQAGQVDAAQVKETVQAILRWLSFLGLLQTPVPGGEPTEILTDERVVKITSQAAGLWQPQPQLGERVVEGDLLGRISDPLTGRILEAPRAPCEGRVFYRANQPLMYEGMVLYKLV